MVVNLVVLQFVDFQFKTTKTTNTTIIYIKVIKR